MLKVSCKLNPVVVSGDEMSPGSAYWEKKLPDLSGT